MPRDLVCFSHLRWDFVYQRPNHLMARAARDRRVFFVEEPIFAPGNEARLASVVRGGVSVVTPHLPAGLAPDAVTQCLSDLMTRLFANQRIEAPNLWYYTPMALPWTGHLRASAIIYDCMDYLAGFRGAPPELLGHEAELLARADLVFSGGMSLHERMRDRHPNGHCLPSSVDLAHFGQARAALSDPADLATISGPRIGYAGVIDERLDLDLIAGLASARPDWQIVLVGPLVKIAPKDVPDAPNIHLLGMKTYQDLPAYLAGWDVGWMPFARNEATRYISPTKTPEYLAAGLPVVSTSIRDVIEPYGRRGLVAIADSVAETVPAIDRVLQGHAPALAEVDAFLAMGSWDRTWAAMDDLIGRLERRPTAPASRPTRRRAPLVRRPAIQASNVVAPAELVAQVARERLGPVAPVGVRTTAPSWAQAGARADEGR